jgi:hypothetical protein
MIRLGVRLALAGGRWSLLPTVLTAIAVGCGTAILLFALSFRPALQARYDRTAWSGTFAQFDLAGPLPNDAVLLSRTADFFDGQPITRIDVAALGPDAPVPPGLPRLPARGEAFVSPALAQLIAEQPPDELGDRYGRIVGQISAAGLGGPNQLAVVEGQPVEALRAAGSRAVDRYNSQGDLPSLSLIVDLILAVAVVGALTPVAIFVATATRLAAARRERRLAAIRLSGATPRQVAVLAAIDALLIAAPGALLGIALFLLFRPLVALIPLAGLTWFPDTIRPPIAQALALLVAVPIVGVLAALGALRPMSISPLGVAQRVRRGRLSRLRLVPLLCSLIVFVASLTVGPELFPGGLLIAVAVSFLGIIVGIAIVGPWLTAGVGRLMAAKGGAVSLLAGRRLLDDPRGSFGAVAGVIMALFVASAFFGFVAFAFHAASEVRVPLRTTTLYAQVPGGEGSVAERLAAQVARTEGVSGVVVVREAVLEAGSGGSRDVGTAWIAPCAAFIAAADLPDAHCGAAPVHLLTASTAPVATGLAGQPGGAGFRQLRSTPTVQLPLASGLTSDRLVPESTRGTLGGLPQVLMEPSAAAGQVSAIRPSFLLVETDGDPSTIERVRTELEVAMPTSGPATGADLAAASARVLDEVGRIISLGVVLTLVVAGCSLAVAVAGALVDRRRPFTLLRMSGVSLRHLQLVLVLEAAAPLVAVAALSCLLGVAVSQLVLRLASAGASSVPLPDPSLFVLFAGSVGGALLIVAAVLPLVRPITSLEETRFE